MWIAIMLVDWIVHKCIYILLHLKLEFVYALIKIADIGIPETPNPLD